MPSFLPNTSPAPTAWGCSQARFVKVREVIKQLELDGWALVATRGSHRQFKHPQKSGRVTVAGKQSIAKQSGVFLP